MTKNREHKSEHGGRKPAALSVKERIMSNVPQVWENGDYKVVHRRQTCIPVFLLQATVAKCEKGSLKISEASVLFT